MDFFEYASVASVFTDTLWVQLVIGALCFAIVFIFQAVALYVIAKREGYKNRWMAFVPFINTYYIGVCAQKNKIYNIDAKTIGLVTAIFEVVLFGAYVFYNVAVSLVSEYVFYTETDTIFGVVLEPYLIISSVPENLKWAGWIYNYFDSYILRWVNLIYLLLEVCLLLAFFQTYACRRYVLFTITSILFPIQGILFFVVRNNKGVNYKEFVRAEQARQYRMYQQYQQQHQNNFYDNPYNRNPYDRGGYNNNNYNNNNQNSYNNQGNSQTPPPDDPFGGLGGNSSNNFKNTDNSNNSNSSSPFDEFDNKD
jgi:hypothetical protein